MHPQASVNMLSPMFATLLEAARWAPSGDNSQPWQFKVDAKASTIELLVDANRDPSPMNADQRMARIAIGAAIENIVRTAEASGWKVCVREPVERQRVILEVCGNREDCGKIEPALRQRCSNRRQYDGGALPVNMVARLSEALAGVSGVKALWITDRSTISKLASVIGEADALMFESRRVRRAFFDTIRCDLPAGETAAEGLSLGSLELSLADRIALPLLPRLSKTWFTWTGARRNLKNRTRRLVLSSAGILVLARRGDVQGDYELGRHFQTTWLALTEVGLCAQAMMSLPVLENLCENDAEFRRDAEFCAAVSTLMTRFLSVVDHPKFGKVGAILRFGRGDQPTCRVGRREIGLEQEPSARKFAPAAVIEGR